MGLFDIFGGGKALALAERIEGLDLSLVAAKAAERHGWDEDRTAEALADYRRFLFLIGRNPKLVIVPWTEDLDLLWHEHILDTRRYRNDCISTVGRLVHHDPHIRRRPGDERVAWDDTRRLYAGEFAGVYPSRFAWLAVAPAAVLAMDPAPDRKRDGGCGGYAACSGGGSSSGKGGDSDGGSDGGGGSSCGGGGGGCGGS